MNTKTCCKCIFRWYDLWVGAFFDRKKRKLYVFPVPMFGIEIQLPTWKRCARRMSMTPWWYTAQCDLVDGHDELHVYEGEPHKTHIPDDLNAPCD